MTVEDLELGLLKTRVERMTWLAERTRHAYESAMYDLNEAKIALNRKSRRLTDETK